jgi:hypothetical protein
LAAHQGNEAATEFQKDSRSFAALSSTTPSALLHASISLVLTLCKATRKKLVPVTKIFLLSGRTPILIFPS